MVRVKVKKNVEVVKPEVMIVTPSILVDVVKEVKSDVIKLACPNCNTVDWFEEVKKWEYRCVNCGKGYSGFPPPR